MPSSIEAPPATRYFYYVYLRSLSSITIFYKFDVDKQTLLPLAQNMLADPGNLSNFISLGSVESQLVLNILRQHRIIEDESKLTFPGVLQIEDSSIFQHFLPNKRRRAVAQPDTYSLLPTLSTEVPVYAPPLHYNAEHVLDALKSFKIGVGSSFLTFEEARLAIIVYSQLVRRRPFNLQHSETTRDSYVVDCYKPDCKFAVTVRAFNSPLPPHYRTPLIITKFEDHTCDPYTHVFQSQRKSASIASSSLLPRLAYPKCISLVFDFIRPPEKQPTMGELEIYYHALDEIFKVNEIHHSSRPKISKMNSHKELAESFANDMIIVPRDSMSPVHISAFYLQLQSPLTIVRITHSILASTPIVILHSPPFQAETEGRPKYRTKPPQSLAPEVFTWPASILRMSPFPTSGFERGFSDGPSNIWEIEGDRDLKWEVGLLSSFGPKGANDYRLGDDVVQKSSSENSEPASKGFNDNAGNANQNSSNMTNSETTSNNAANGEASENRNARSVNSNINRGSRPPASQNSTQSSDNFEMKTPFLDFLDQDVSDSEPKSPDIDDELYSSHNDTHFEIPFRLSDMHFFPKHVQEKLTQTFSLSSVSNKTERAKKIAGITKYFSVSYISKFQAGADKQSTSNLSTPVVESESPSETTTSSANDYAAPSLSSSYLVDMPSMIPKPRDNDYLPSYCDVYECANPRNGQHAGYCSTHDKHYSFMIKYKDLVEKRTFFNPFVFGDYVTQFYPDLHAYKNLEFRRLTIITADMRRMARSAVSLVEVGHTVHPFFRQNAYHVILAVGNTPEHNITILGACICYELCLEAYVEFFSELKLAYGSLFEERNFSFVSAVEEDIRSALALIFPNNYHCISLEAVHNRVSKRTNDIEFMELVSTPNSRQFLSRMADVCGAPIISIDKYQLWTIGLSATPRYGRNYSTNIQAVNNLLTPYLRHSVHRLPLVINNLQTEIINSQQRSLKQGPLLQFFGDKHAFSPAASGLLAHASLFVDIFTVEPVEDSSTIFKVSADEDSLIRCLKNNTSAIPLLYDALYFDRDGTSPVRRVRIKSTQTLSQYDVDLEARKCSCTFYQDSQLPCIHALACILKFKDCEVSKFCSPIYHLDHYLETLDSCDGKVLNPPVSDIQFLHAALSKIKLQDLKSTSRYREASSRDAELHHQFNLVNQYLKYPYPRG